MAGSLLAWQIATDIPNPGEKIERVKTRDQLWSHYERLPRLVTGKDSKLFVTQTNSGDPTQTRTIFQSNIHDQPETLPSANQICNLNNGPFASTHPINESVDLVGNYSASIIKLSTQQAKELGNADLKDAYCAPVILLDRDGKPFQAGMVAISTETNSQDPNHQEHTEMMANILSIITANHILDEMERSGLTPEQRANSIVECYLSALERWDPATAKHSKDVADLCDKLFEMLPNNDKKLEISPEMLRRSALLHDIGKLIISKELLIRKGPLVDDEIYKMQNHAAFGEILLLLTPNIQSILSLDGVADHHEAWEGQGYPNNKNGDNISLLSQLVTLADKIRALTEHREYPRSTDNLKLRDKNAMTEQELIVFLQNNIDHDKKLIFDPSLLASIMILVGDGLLNIINFAKLTTN